MNLWSCIELAEQQLALATSPTKSAAEQAHAVQVAQAAATLAQVRVAVGEK